MGGGRRSRPHADARFEQARNLYAAGDYHFGLVRILVRRGQPEKAVALMRRRPADDAASHQLLTAHAEFWRQTGHLDEAVETYGRLLEIHGPLPEVIVPMGRS